MSTELPAAAAICSEAIVNAGPYKELVSRQVGLPLRRLLRYPGSVVGWENHLLYQGTAFVVELPPAS
jgi:hypothetical protein